MIKHVDILQKSDMEKKFKETEKKLYNELSKSLDKKFKDKEEEKTMLEKEIIKKQSNEADKNWGKIKNKDLRLSEIEHKIMNIEEFLKSSAEKFNDMVNKFNNHIEKNNSDFDLIKEAVKYGSKY